MNVLIADDELRLRKVVSLHLKKSGFTVIEAGNGKQALEKAEEAKPDIIVLDVQMPEMDGLEACRRFKEGQFSDIPVILLTAMAQGEDMEKGRQAGAVKYLTKPFSPKELVETINEVVGS